MKRETSCLGFRKRSVYFQLITVFLTKETLHAFTGVQYPTKIRTHVVRSTTSSSNNRSRSSYLQRKNHYCEPHVPNEISTLFNSKSDDSVDTGTEDVRSEHGGHQTNVGSKIGNALRQAASKFKNRPGTYLLIPLVAAVVGWFTNYLAVKMLFYPINYLGLPLYRVPEQPLGFIGWQGIVPCKSREMGEAMVNMVTTELLSVEEVFKRLNPKAVADILAPEVPKLGNSIVKDLFPRWLVSLPTNVFSGLPQKTKEILTHWNHRFLVDFTIDMQNNIGKLLDVNKCVVNQFLADRTMLGKVFQIVGHVEFDFLINSGLWFGFILGLIQMVVALFWDNPWTLSIGGTIVGLATNWLALKWVFEPVNPTKVGPFVLQGLFIKRQQAVAAEFGDFFTKTVLTSEKLWHSILNDPSTSPHFNQLFTKHLTKYANLVTGSLGLKPEPEVVAMAAKRALQKFPNHLAALHPYVDKTLALKDTIRVEMGKLSCEKFERVLHPIFEEDELTLIICGGVLGFLAGLVQQGLETGAITMPTRKEAKDWICSLPTKAVRMKDQVLSFSPKNATKHLLQTTRAKFAALIILLRNLVGKNNEGSPDAVDDTIP